MAPKRRKGVKSKKVEKNVSEEEIEEPASQEQNLLDNLLKRKIPSRLFVKKDKPMIFYIAPCDTKEQLTNLIVKGGGLVQKFPAPGVITITEKKSDIPSKIPGECYSINYITDSIQALKRVDLTKYLINLKRKSINRDSIASPRKRILFTNEDDERLVEFVNNHGEYTPSGSRLWKLAEEKELTDGHTWQSMRSRYLKVARKLNFNGNDEEDEMEDGREVEDEEEENDHSQSERKKEKLLRTEDSFIEPEYIDKAQKDDGEEEDELDILTQEVTKPRTSVQPKHNKNKNNNINNEEDEIEEEQSEPEEYNVKEIVLSIINNLMLTTKLPRSVVVHGLIVNNGIVSDTIQYLRNPQEFYSSRSKSAQIWTYTEDKMILDKHERGLEDLGHTRGPQSLQKRQLFLES